MGWNKEIEYEATWEKLRYALTSKSVENKHRKIQSRKIKISILLIQLRNGSRISEAVEAYNQFVENKKREQQVRVRKRGWKYIKDENGKKKRATNSVEPDEKVERLMVIPDEVPDTLPKYESTLPAITTFTQYWFGFNPHALRYCYITEASRQGQAPQTIAAATGHASLTHILKYCEKVMGEDMLRKGLL